MKLLQRLVPVSSLSLCHILYALLDNCQQCRLCTLLMSYSATWCPGAGLNEEDVVERNRIPKICQSFLKLRKYNSGTFVLIQMCGEIVNSKSLSQKHACS